MKIVRARGSAAPRLGAALAVGVPAGAGVALGASEAPEAALVAVASLGTVGLTWFMVSSVVPVLTRRPSIPGAYLLLFMVEIYGPGLLLVGGDPHAAVAPAFLIALNVALVSVGTGVVAAGLVARYTRGEAVDFFRRAVVRTPGAEVPVPLAAAGLALGVALTVAYVRVVESVPLVEAVRNPGAYLLLVELREESFKTLNQAARYLFYWARALLFPMLLLLCLNMYLATRARLWLALTVASGLSGAAFASLSLAKGPVAVLVLGALLATYLVRHERLRAHHVLLGAAAVLAFPVWVVLQVSPDSALTPAYLGETLLAIGSRIFQMPAFVLYHYFVVFPERMEHLGGASIGLVSNLFGWSHVNVPNVVYREMFPTGLELGNANASFIGAMYADFGLPGVMLGGLAVGMLAQALQTWLTRRGKTVTTLTLYAFCIIGMWLLNHTSLPVVLWSNGLLLALLLPVVVRAAHALVPLTRSGPAA
jgi:hypothetical protein